MDANVKHQHVEGQEETGSQAVRAQLRLREMVLDGELAAGSRITELAIVEKLGVSRTPIRAALMRLEQEGLLQALPNGGYAVRTFTEREVSDAIEMRGTMEGLSARLAAERGVPAGLLERARFCLDQIDLLLSQSALDDVAFSEYVSLNEQYHQLLSEMADSDILRRELERVASLPFASPSAFAVVQANSAQARDMLVVAQDQHRQVFDAIEQREGARAESIMREHARLARRNLRQAMQSPMTLPAARLIRNPR